MITNYTQMKIYPFYMLLLICFLPVRVFGQLILIEAEEGTTNLESSDSRAGFSGNGYLTGMNENGDFVNFTLQISESEVYKIEIAYASISEANSITDLYIDDTYLGEFRSLQSETFVLGNAAAVILDAGEHTIQIEYNSAILDVDFLLVTPISEIEGEILIEGTTRIEAENGLLFGTRTEFGTSGFSGMGYVSNFDMPDKDKLRIIVQSPEKKEYELKIGFATPYGYKENYLSINGGPNQNIQFEDNTSFTEITVGKVTLEAGVNTLEMIHHWGWFELDYFEFSTIVGDIPLAESQGNLILDDRDSDGQEIADLDGSTSTDIDGEITMYSWQFLDGIEIGSGPTLAYPFDTGTHLLRPPEGRLSRQRGGPQGGAEPRLLPPGRVSDSRGSRDQDRQADPHRGAGDRPPEGRSGSRGAPRVPAARALQGQGRALRGRAHCAQGSEEEVVEG